MPSAPDTALGKDFFFRNVFAKCPCQDIFTAALGKDISKKKFFAKRRVRGIRQSIFQKKIFAECQIWDTRQRNLKKIICRVPNSRHSAKKDMAEHRYVGQPMPSAERLPRAWHSAKKSFTESLFLPSAILCRVRHSAKKVFAEYRFLTLGKAVCTRQRSHF